MNKSTIWLISGIIFIIGGFLALANPFAASFAAETIAAYVFLIGGCLQFFSLFASSNKSWGSVFFALVCILIGVFLLANPLQGIVTLTIMLAIFFVVSGLLKIMASSALRGTPFFWPVIISGIISLALGIYIFSMSPTTFMAILGLFLGIELLLNGITSIALSMSNKNTNVLK